MAPPNDTPKRILVFNPRRKLIMIAHSITALSSAFQITAASITQVCNGTNRSCIGLYFRYLTDDVIVENEDLGTLTLEEFDKLCGLERKYNHIKKMFINQKKFNKQQKDED